MEVAHGTPLLAAYSKSAPHIRLFDLMCRISREQTWSTSRVAKFMEKVPIVGNYFTLLQMTIAEDEQLAGGEHMRCYNLGQTYFSHSYCLAQCQSPRSPRCHLFETVELLFKKLT